MWDPTTHIINIDRDAVFGLFDNTGIPIEDEHLQ
jgi:hypothetical protein